MFNAAAVRGGTSLGTTVLDDMHVIAYNFSSPACKLWVARQAMHMALSEKQACGRAPTDQEYSPGRALAEQYTLGHSNTNIISPRNLH